MGLKEQTANRKSQITKKLKLVRDLEKPGADIDRSWRLLGEVETKRDEMMDLYDDLVVGQKLEVDTKAVLEEKVKSVDEYSAKMDEVVTSLIARESADRATPSSLGSISSSIGRRDGDRSHQLKPISDLKPFTLSSESEPFEMRIWIEKSKAYFKASHADVLDLDGRFLKISSPAICVSLLQKKSEKPRPLMLVALSLRNTSLS